MTTTHLRGKNKNKSVSIPKSPLQENDKENKGFRKGMKKRLLEKLKKKTEFNLSKKIVDLTGGIEFLENTDFALDIEDVKEFIKILKEEIGGDSADYFKLSEIIDKLVGDKLI
jgi:hypothetical protein